MTTATPTRPTTITLDPAVDALNAAYACRDTLADLCQQYPDDPDLAARLAASRDLLADAMWRAA